MRIGLNGGGPAVDRMVEQAVEAEADGFSSLWYASAVAADPLVAMAMAGRATTTIELGTRCSRPTPAIPCSRPTGPLGGRRPWAARLHPRRRALAPARRSRHARPRLRPPGRHTEEYVTVLTALLAARRSTSRARTSGSTSPAPPAQPVACGVGPRAAPAAGGGRARRRHDPLDGQRPGDRVPRGAADQRRGRAPPGGRRPASSPACRSRCTTTWTRPAAVAAEQFAGYGVLPNYRRILDHGGAAGPADAAIVGDEARWPTRSRRCSTPAPPTCGPRSSRSATTARPPARTRALLKELANA